ncbi:hypothetical protein HPP92_020595 [Vanilla planifolia]|uniref:Uncharacterized protein n=1 Tax=Vanilla planifolia TaxID=51239 RepID=A0A835Q306_VANPL|nr:hypothetical protein HPP92_020595 [Vanilla planifolia]
MAESDMKEKEEGGKKKVSQLFIGLMFTAMSALMLSRSQSYELQEELINYIHKKARKRAEIVSEKQEKKNTRGGEEEHLKSKDVDLACFVHHTH